MATAKTTGVQVDVQPVKQGQVDVKIVGDGPLVVHRFSTKAQAQMLAKQCKVAWPKEAKDPVVQYQAATHFINEDGAEVDCPADLQLIVNGKVKEFLGAFEQHMRDLAAVESPRFGFPAVGVKAAAIRGAKALGLVMADMKGAFYIPREYIEIKGNRRMRSDMVRISHSTSDVRFRPEFTDWSAEFPVIYNTAVMTPDLLYNMIHTGGFACGIGEWRPEKGGSWGMFHVESID